jgi:NADH pyrophosphatase NudC (nudix superfamily)
MNSPFTYCPHCRSANIEFLHAKQVVCIDCGFGYFHNVATAAGAIIRHQSDILLAVRGRNPARGMLDLPGGFVDPGENLEQALRREIREELGLSVGAMRYLFSFANTYHFENVLYNTTDAIFEIWLEKKPIVHVADDVTAVQWVALQDIQLDTIAFASIRQAIAQLQQ